MLSREDYQEISRFLQKVLYADNVSRDSFCQLEELIDKIKQYLDDTEEENKDDYINYPINRRS